MDYGAIVVGAGHNGLICAAYLAKAGIPTLLVEARSEVGGCASTVDALGARVNICNCDHAVFRTTPVIDELDLGRHGLRYLDAEPAQVQASWDGEAAWPDLSRRRPHDRRARADPSRRSRRLPPLLRGRDPRRRARARDGVRAADSRRRPQAPRSPTSTRRRDDAPLESPHRGRRAAVVLLTRGRDGPRGDHRSRGVGAVAVHPSHGPRRAHLRDEARRTRRSSRGWQRGGARKHPPRVHRRGRHAALGRASHRHRL